MLKLVKKLKPRLNKKPARKPEPVMPVWLPLQQFVQVHRLLPHHNLVLWLKRERVYEPPLQNRQFLLQRRQPQKVRPLLRVLAPKRRRPSRLVPLLKRPPLQLQLQKVAHL